MSTASTASALQHLLEAEGAVIHAALQARALPSMGGGVGMILTKKVPAGSVLARFPFRSMITARKARFNLAMAEVALELREGKAAAAAAEEALLPVIPFTSRVWSESEFESQVRSQKVRRAIDDKVEELEEALDSTETIVCYILLMAALHGRWDGANTAMCVSETEANEQNTEDEEQKTTSLEVDSSPSTPKTVLRFTHENRWMRTWIHALPVQYDNLLELAPEQQQQQQQQAATAASGTQPMLSSASSAPPAFSTSSSSPVPPLPLAASYTTSSEWLSGFVSLARFRATALREQRTIQQRYRKCSAALRSLRGMPCGVEAGEPVSSTGSTTGDEEERKNVEKAGTQGRCSAQCTLGQFLWAFNTLMSRGFYFPEETWALMPYVDYFNYALDSNGTMYPQEDDPDDADSLSSKSLALVESVREAAAAAPRKQSRRTGLRSARVGHGAIPLANYNTYEFQLIRPLHAAGEQVMLHYGAYSDVELLMWYGFTLRPSLLPTNCLPAAVGAAAAALAGEARGFLSLLPPGMADNDSHSLLRTAHALRDILPQIVCATTRVAYYRKHIQATASSICQEERDEEAAERGAASNSGAEDVADEEEAYNTWAKALHRAYRLPLSPLADAEGNYPTAMRGQTWLDALFASFLQTQPLLTPASASEPSVNAAAADATYAAAAVHLDGWLRQWIARRWPVFAETAFPGVSKGCGLGVLGLSPVLHAAITSSFWAGPQEERMSAMEQMQLIRGIAWAELYVNAMAEPAVAAGSASTSGKPVSAAAAAYAQIVSLDQWALLRFLALESTDTALQEYLAYESERD